MSREWTPPSWPGAEQVVRDLRHRKTNAAWPGGKAPAWAEEMAAHYKTALITESALWAVVAEVVPDA